MASKFSVKSPQFVNTLFPDLIWKIPKSRSTIYLTFDDGPNPEVTPWVLNILKQYNAKATFFVVGENAAHYPGLLNTIKHDGHAVANHTYNHLSGWDNSTNNYFRNIVKSQKYTNSSFFRPPYGKITIPQKNVLKKHFFIVMWDVLTRDFDISVSPEQCLRNALVYTNGGSVVIFHDSIKSWRNMSYALPAFLAYFSRLEFTFEALSNDILSNGYIR